MNTKTVNKTAWHFRLLKFFDFSIVNPYFRSYENVSLCTYFWSVALATVLSSLAISFIGLILWLLFAPIFLYGGIAAVTIGRGLWMTFLILTVVFGIADGDEHPTLYKFTRFFSNKTSTAVEPTLNILTEMYKAHKEKYCPLIKYED